MSVKAYARWAMYLMVLNGAVCMSAIATGAVFITQEQWWGLAACVVVQWASAWFFVRARRIWRAARMTMVWDARRRAAPWN